MEDLKTKIEGLEENKIALVVVDSTKYSETNLQILKYLTATKEIPGIYVTVNKPYTSIKRTLAEGEVDTDDILFIDAVSKNVGGGEEEENCTFLNSPENLSDLSIAISQAVKSMDSSQKFFYLDSLSTLGIYHELSEVSKFSHFLTGKLRLWDVSGILISLKKETNEKLISRMTQFCDKVINIEKEED